MKAGRNSGDEPPATGEALSPIVIHVEAACKRCRREGTVVRGLWKLGRSSPNSFLVAGVIVAIWILAWPVSWILMSLGDSLSGMPGPFAGWDWARLLGWLSLGLVVGISYTIGLIPVSFLVCSKCKRIVSFRIGRGIPHRWLGMVAPMRSCPRCEYSLVGVGNEPRCPECGAPFPVGWVTALQQSGNSLELRVDVPGAPGR